MNASRKLRLLQATGDARNGNEKQILKAIEENDVEALKLILKNPVGRRLGYNKITILSAAVLTTNIDIIKYLIASGCDPGEIDEYGRSALHFHLTERRQSADDEKHRLEIADILLAAHSNPTEAVFLNRNVLRNTPFLLACDSGFETMILRFLDFFDPNLISMDHLIGGSYGNNVFHYVMRPIRLEIVRALIEKIPYFDQLIDAKNDDGETPLCILLVDSENGGGELIALVNLLFQHGASPDFQDPVGLSYLDWAIFDKNASLVETVLRAGYRFRTDYTSAFQSALFSLLKSDQQKCGSESIRMIEMILAFGYDLQKDILLYTTDERPLEVSSPEDDDLRDTSDMDQVVLEDLRELRRSNKLLSLQRQCRNTIRRQLKSKADEVIGNFICIPDRIKSLLLVQDEQPLLKIPTSVTDEERK